MLVLRSVVFNVLFYALLVGMLVIGIPLIRAPEKVVKAYAALWGRLSLGLLRAICGTRLDYRGVERIPPGGLIVAAKHQSFLDIMVLLPLAPSFTYVMKHELSLIPLFGPLMLRGGMIAIDRSRGRHIMGDLNVRVKQVVEAGQQLIIFPEGTRRPPGAEPLYKSGVSHLYTATGATCLPVALNTGVFWPRQSFLRYPGTLVIDVLDPIEPGLSKSAFQTRLQDEIEAASDRQLAVLRASGEGRL
ncbi:lysophospholipid acyltransferase family protein [Lichenihabitans sp. Uapishka_5]|uniref:lysophospholipid acyltransferase family protein n=1 Tax=Lichenihabitans sp. Uapishka_5 TaxID=3037302 RepID=UPI0029E7D3B5|nr:lysophospholipid acyltransferase family protein [Lichenihabitans sp. Uapishka_5]MDX7952240.1 lysophospholipid acyltransferase family protein [Lichenihabitans sp. Uapishka_5]